MNRRLTTAIDLRLVEIWVTIWEIRARRMTEAALAWALRAAYEKGYSDALREDKLGGRASLYIDSGYRPPEGTV